MEDWYATPRVEGQAAESEDWAKRYVRWAGYGVCVIALLTGFAEGARPTHAGGVLSAILYAWAVTYFCALDARANGRVFVHAYWIPTTMAWPVASLVHLLRNRGPRGLGAYFGYALTSIASFMAGWALGRLIA